MNKALITIIISQIISCGNLIFSKPLKEIKVGDFIKQIYTGEWNGITPQMNKYINSKKGKISILLQYNPINTLKKLEFDFQFTEGKFLENKNIYISTLLDLENEKQSELKGKKIKSKTNLFKNLFEITKSTDCLISSSLDIKDKNGKIADISSNEMDLILEGKIFSENCDINFNFIVEPKKIVFAEIFFFVFFQVFAVIVGFYPFFREIRNNGNSEFVKNLSNLTFLGNIMIDIVLITVNITFAMRVLVAYFEFLTLISIFFMISILFKVRFFLDMFEKNIILMNLSERELQKAKCVFLMKFSFGIFLAIIVANYVIIYYWIFGILFLYPLWQIFHNCFNVVKKHCFYFKLHFLFIFPQIFYPIILRSGLFSFFSFKPDFTFILTIFSLITFFLIIMIFQKYFGRSFFLPKFLMPNYFNYYQKLDKIEKNEDTNCPICFGDLTEDPDDGVDGKFLMKKFMQTPCKHNFHVKCLQLWMDEKLLCPYCRTALTPY